MRSIVVFFLCLIMGGLTLSTGEAIAHPEDEFCNEEGGMDPELCRELAKLDRDGQAEDIYGIYGTTNLEVISLDRPVIETIGLYIKLGFIHIIPKGYDHILFVIALFLASRRWQSLLWQISAFTVAHTITLAMAVSGLITVPACIVEPLIALSIAAVAIENILVKDITKWRPLVIFGFGLFHGLGFAGVLSDLGLERGQFLTSLISFNVGVEFGQLSIIAFALLLVRLAQYPMPSLAGESTYRRLVVIPGSIIITLFGLFWFVSRILS